MIAPVVEGGRPEVLVAAALPAPTMATLHERFIVHHLADDLDPVVLGRVTAMAASTLAGPIDAALLTRMPALRIIANFGVGYDNIDVVAAAARGVIVTNTGGVLDEEVADLTLGLLLATIRRLPQADRYVREGRWLAEGNFPLSPSLRGRKVGILGFGGIGKAIARRLDAFAVDIAYHTRNCQPDQPYRWHPSARDLAKASDVLIVIVPGGAATRHLVDADVLAALGPQGVLINVARGSVVDEAALIAALQSGGIAAAGLDVHADEPRVAPALIAMDNVVLLPHVGSASHITRQAMGQRMIDNLLAWFETGRPLSPVPETRHLVEDPTPG